MDGSHQHIDLLDGIVKSKRRARRCWHAEALHHGHRAMMPGAHRHPFLVENRADIVRVHVIQDKRQHAGFFFSGANNAQAVDA